MALQPTRAASLVEQQFFSPQADSKSAILQALTGVVKQGRADASQQAKNQLFAQGAQSAFQGTQTAEEAAQLFASDPARAKALTESAGVFTKKGREGLANTAFKIMNIQDPAQRNQALQQISTQMQQAGDDPSVFASLIGQNPQAQNQGLQALRMASLSVKDQVGIEQQDRSFGLDERRTRAQEANVRSQIAERGRVKPAALTAKAKDLASAGFVPGTPEFQQQMLRLLGKPTGTTVNVGGENISVDDQIKIAVATKRAEEEAKSQGKNRAAFQKADVESGILAAQSIPTLQRSINLLKTIKTGGIDSALLRGKQFLGIESGDEAELQNNLRKSVLAQLKPTFGAAFTVQEGKLLADIEASTEKSTAGNIRLLQRGLDLAKKRANIGIRAAREGRDKRSAETIQGFLDNQIQPEQQVAPDQTGTATITPASTVAPSGRTGGVLSVDSQGNRAFVFPDGTFEEVQ